MAQFYICHNKHQEPIIKQTQLDQEQLDLIVASKYVSNAALKVSDIKTKLGLAKISQYLQKMDQKMQALQKIQNPHQKRNKSPSFTSYLPSQDKENIQVCNQPKAFAKIQTSKSQITYDNPTKTKIQLKQTELPKKSLIDTLHWRQVVTNNSLDESPRLSSRAKLRVYDQDRDSVKIQQLNAAYKLEQDNKILEKCLSNLFEFFSSKNLLQFNGRLQLDQCETLSMQLSTKFQRYQQQNNIQLSNLFAKSVLLQQTVDKLSLQFNQQCQQKQTQQVNQLQKQLSEFIQSNQKYEMMIYIKDQQIKSLKAIISDLQNRLKKATQIDNKSNDKTRTKSYIRFFEGLDDLSSTAN